MTDWAQSCRGLALSVCAGWLLMWQRAPEGMSLAFANVLRSKSPPQWRAVTVRLMENAEIEGKVVYKGPQNLQVTEAFVLKSAA